MTYDKTIFIRLEKLRPWLACYVLIESNMTCRVASLVGTLLN